MTDTRGQSVQFQRDGGNLNDSLFSAQSSIWDSQTLLSWQSAPESPSESIFQWQYDRVWESPATERDRIVTDRPHLAEATSTVGLGTIQLETGYSFSSDSAGGVRTRSHSFPESLLRVGVFAEWFELRLAGNYLIEQAAPPAGPTSTIRGSDDVYVGAKVALFKQYGWLPDFTVFPQARLPTGSSGFTAGEIRPGVNLAYSWAVTKILEIECNTVLNRERDDAGNFYLEVFQTVNFEYDVSDKSMLFTEYIAFSPSGSQTAQFQNYFHSTARWRARNGLGWLVKNAVDFLHPLVYAGKRSDGTSVARRNGTRTGISGCGRPRMSALRLQDACL